MTASPTTDFLPANTFTPKQVIVILLCFLAAIIDGVDLTILPYTAPAIVKDWDVSSEAIGFVFSASLFGMTVGAMFLGPLADIHGRRIIISLALILSGLATAMTFYAGNITQLVLLRMLAGFGLGILGASLAVIVGEYSPSRYRNLLVAAKSSSIGIGAMGGGMVVSALIMDYGWRILYFYAGLLTVLTGICFYVLVPESMSFLAKRKPDQALAQINKILSYLGHRAITQLPDHGAKTQDGANVISLLKTKERRFNTLLIWPAFFFGFGVVFFLSSWMPNILVGSGLTQKAAIEGTVVMNFGAILGAILIGWLSRQWTLNRLIGVIFFLGAFLFVLFSVFIGGMSNTHSIILFGFLFLMGVCINGAFSNLHTVAVIIYPPQIRSTGLGWCAGLGRFGAVISPALAGIFLGLGVTMGKLFLIFAMPAIVAGMFSLFIRLRELK